MSKTAPWNTILHGDCIEQMAALDAGSVDLAFADPPFNIGYEYDVYEDRKQHEEYIGWSKQWIAGVHRVLKDDGTFWLAIGDEYAAELKLAAQEVGFHCRSWVIWYYTFGVNCKYKFSRSHAHLFYFVKHPEKFTFRSEELENRIPSARQLVYADNRANPRGRLPDDTWVLRPQDLADCFTAEEDTWYFPRVAGTFKERAGFHGCQMPEQLLGRIIRCCSHEGELVLDPFSGSATTLAVAKKLGRRFLGFDLSEDYITRGRKRLEGICAGDALDGAAEPTISAPATPEAGSGKKKGKLEQARPTDESTIAAAKQAKMFESGLIEAFRKTYDGYSIDRLIADPQMNVRFVDHCRQIGLVGEPRIWNESLFRLRKAGRLAEFPATQRTAFAWEECDQYLFASEIAWGQLIDKRSDCESLDTILCDPQIAAEFDAIAKKWAPGYTSLHYRWAALKLRKAAKSVRSRAKTLGSVKLGPAESFAGKNARNLPEAPGYYIVLGRNEKTLYAGEANNLRERLTRQFSDETKKLWSGLSSTLMARFYSTDCPYSMRLAYQWRLVDRYQPKLNPAVSAVLA